MRLNVTNSLSCSTLNDTLSHSLFFRFICSAVWFVLWELLAAPRGDAGSSNIICCDYVCVCVYGPVRVIAISSGLQGWPWTVQLTTIVNVSFFFDCYHTITDSFDRIFQTIHTVLETKTHFSKLLTHFTCLRTRSNLLNIFCKTLHNNSNILENTNTQYNYLKNHKMNTNSTHLSMCEHSVALMTHSSESQDDMNTSTSDCVFWKIISKSFWLWETKRRKEKWRVQGSRFLYLSHNTLYRV